jgi:hypothetical protein
VSANAGGPSANEITARLLIEIPKRYDCLCWRNNTGSGIGWSSVKKAIGILKRATANTWRDAIAEALKCLRRPIDFGLVGSADILFVMGKPHHLFGGIEVKNPETDDEQSPGQMAWELRIIALGGFYVIAESVEQGLADLEKAVRT